jgi:hypothetical protein
MHMAGQPAECKNYRASYVQYWQHVVFSGNEAKNAPTAAAACMTLDFRLPSCRFIGASHICTIIRAFRLLQSDAAAEYWLSCMEEQVQVVGIAPRGTGHAPRAIRVLTHITGVRL